MPADVLTESDGRILSLLDSPSEIETPTPGVKVWLAGDTTAEGTPRPVIVKRIREASGMGQRKARATEALHLLHANILRPRRWMAEGGYLYVIREVVRGRNLRQALTTLSGERPGPELLRKLLLPVMDALAYAHAQGVVHGGVSSENILIAEDGRLLLMDFATTDPNAPRHQPYYNGTVSVAGDVRAFGNVLATYLPTTGNFQNIAVRGRIEGLIRRCDSIDDLREILQSLEKLAASPVPTPPGGMARPKDGVPTTYPGGVSPIIGLPRLEMPNSLMPSEYDLGLEESDPAPGNTPSSVQVSVSVVEPAVYIPQGGGGIITLHVRNEGAKPLVLRMITTQHAWINARPVALPLTLPVSGAERLDFAVSAARLSPGEYRSEVYLSLHSVGEYDEITNTGWEKYTAEVRITVVPNTGSLNISSQASVPGAHLQGHPAYPTNAPKIPANPGCAVLSLLLIAVPFYLLPVITQLFARCGFR